MKAMDILEAMTNIDDSLIEYAKPVPKKKGIIRNLILLAAIIAALTMTAFASAEITNWFKSYFSRFSEEPLSQNQIAFIEENTTDLSQSKTCIGWTLAVESAISDGINGYIKLKLTAPEHVVLDADSYYPANPEYLTPKNNHHDNLNGTSLGCGLVEDNDNLENTVSMMIYINGCVMDHTEWKLHITRIDATYFENPGTDAYRMWDETVAVGPWDFNITFKDTGKEELEFIAEPVPERVNISLGDPIYMDVNITSIKLRAMSAEIKYEYLDPDITGGIHVIPAGDFEEIYVVMEDGTQVLMVSGTGYPGGCTYCFLTPIVLEEISHILLPNGTELPIP